MQIAVAQIGARRHYAVPRAIYAAEMLAHFYTDSMAPPYADFAVKASRIFGGHSLLSRWRERSIPEIPRRMLTTFPGFALKLKIRSRRKGSIAQTYARYAENNREFCNLVVRAANVDADACYVFNGAGLEILQHAKATGKFAILDQTMAPISYTERLLAEERARWPDWEFGEAGVCHHQLADREAAEWELADRIICGSQFVVDSMADEGASTRKCEIVPFCSVAGVHEKEAEISGKRRLRVLFVGTLELRKGIAYLYEAAKQTQRDCEFRAVGGTMMRPQAMAKLARVVEITGRVPRSEIANHMKWADVMVLPTLAEGSANVCYEALGRGLPVITTHNAGSVIQNGVDGFIVPARNAEAITEKLQLLCDRELLSSMGSSAVETARHFSEEDYRRRLVSALMQESKH